MADLCIVSTHFQHEDQAAVHGYVVPFDRHTAVNSGRINARNYRRIKYRCRDPRGMQLYMLQSVMAHGCVGCYERFEVDKGKPGGGF